MSAIALQALADETGGQLVGESVALQNLAIDSREVKAGRTVVMAAGDTFRAAARPQAHHKGLDCLPRLCACRARQGPRAAADGGHSARRAAIRHQGQPRRPRERALSAAAVLVGSRCQVGASGRRRALRRPSRGDGGRHDGAQSNLHSLDSRLHHQAQKEELSSHMQ